MDNKKSPNLALKLNFSLAEVKKQLAESSIEPVSKLPNQSPISSAEELYEEKPRLADVLKEEKPDELNQEKPRLRVEPHEEKPILKEEVNENEHVSHPKETSLVLMGCPSCLTYIFVSEDDRKCARCKSYDLVDISSKCTDRD
ncbi:hypothetical protein NMG60_11025939 [Bertholletia excelsa]